MIIRKQCFQIIFASIEIQPALPLQKREEHHAIEESLSIEPLLFVAPSELNGCFCFFKYPAIFSEEFSCNRLNAKCFSDLLNAGKICLADLADKCICWQFRRNEIRVAAETGQYFFTIFVANRYQAESKMPCMIVKNKNSCIEIISQNPLSNFKLFLLPAVGGQFLIHFSSKYNQTTPVFKVEPAEPIKVLYKVGVCRMMGVINFFRSKFPT